MDKKNNILKEIAKALKEVKEMQKGNKKSLTLKDI